MRRMMAILLLISVQGVASAQGNAIPRGNGVIVDDVARDVRCNEQHRQCHSALVETLNTNLELSGRNFYIFPDFANIITMPGDKLQPVNDHCSSRIQQYVFNYSSLPLIKSSILKMPALGQCLPGQTVTRVYHQSEKKGARRLVLPMVNGSAYELNQASDSELIATASIIARVIIADKDAAGVSFDLEGPTMTARTTRVFVGKLAEKLADKHKFVAVFDPKLRALAPLSRKYHNIIALVALYDYGLNPDQPYAPVSVTQYRQHSGDHAVRAYFGGYGKQVPVMFVTPAAATTTLYENLNVFNTNFRHGQPNLNGISQAPRSCSKSNLPVTIVSRFLIDPPGQQHGSALDYFVSRCQRYSNADVSQSQYFHAALQAITHGYQASSTPNKRLIGTALYNAKPKGFYGLTCAKNAWNKYYTSSLHKQCLGFYPDAISRDIWQALQQWQRPQDKASAQ